MTTREFYEAKAKECGYDDFLHWIDCYDYTLQPQKIVEWTDELVKNLTMHNVIKSVCPACGSKYYDEDNNVKRCQDCYTIF